MKSENLKLKIFISSLGLILLLFSLFLYQYFKFNDGKLHLVFCNVGQGDGIFIRTPSGVDIIVDAGPDDSILNCLSSNMPFWDRTIELSLLTHPHADHMRGFISIFRRYEVKNFATEALSNDTVLYQEVVKEVRGERLEIQNLYAGDRFRLSDGLELKTLGPSKEFLERTSPTGVISESEGFGNLITLVSYGPFKALLTGDSQLEGLRDALQQGFGGKQSVDIFQIPHHGSRFGLESEIVERLDPKLAVISVGKNKYGHPSPSIIKILDDLKVRHLRTDRHGDIEIVVDKNGTSSVH